MKTFKQFLGITSPSVRENKEDREVYAKKIVDAPAWSPAQAEKNYRIGDVTFSSSDGLGSVPSNTNVWYEGFVATVKPSTFLNLALSDDGAQEATAVEIVSLIKEGYAVGIPFVFIQFSEDEDDLFSLPKIKGHEGRGRMRAVRRLLGDTPIPVHFFLRGGLRSRDITPQMIKQMKIGIISEGKSIVKKPLETIWVNEKEV